MDPLLRPIVEDELEAFVLVVGYGFADRSTPADHEHWVRAEMDRTVGAFVGGEMVATGRNYSLELTLPGDVVIPAGGVSWIATRPTHRRQGLLAQVMGYLVNESRERDEMVSMLTASEGGIYRRFGYGVASRMAKISVDRGATDLAALPSTGVLRMVEADAAAAIAAPLFDRVRRTRVGAVSRPDAWWFEEWAARDWIDPRRRFDVVYEENGRVEGYALYAVDGDWPDGITKQVVAVRDLIATTPQAEAALWNYLFNIDLTVGIRSWNTPLDSLLPWLLTNVRQLRTESVRDSLWVRPIDTARLLASRAYGATGELVLAVSDPSLGLDETAGRFLVRAGSDGPTCTRSDREADLVMDADALGAISLGGFAPSVLARASRIAARDQDSLLLADAMFRVEREPFPYTWF